ncbi:cytochrome P450 [Cadophora sp. MPI-SDFR-AT-0126]|nr:cytochrome P450 [Leotiomycetes sp. MPI-SDFR-AT-0126]
MYSLIFAAFLAAGVFFRWYTSTASTNTTEPPIFHPKVPFIGHLLGIIQFQADYLQKVCEKVQKPIFTLKIFSTKIYIVTSPDLVQAVYRNAKTLSFDPISTAASKRIFQMTDRQMELLRGSAHGVEDGEELPVAKATYKIMHATMQTGPSLNEMNTRALNKFATFLEDIDDEGQEATLFEWLKHHFTIATAEALYGPINPISEDVSMIQKLIDFESSVGLLFLDIFPSLTCPAGHHARSAFTEAFKRYYSGKHNLNASAIIQGRFSVLSAGGFTTDDIASFDIGILMGATMNSNPGLFWLISHIYADPDLLSSIRSELASITTLAASPSGNSLGKREAILNINLLQHKCPLLMSAWQETLRVQAATIANRLVLEDTVLHSQSPSNATHLLKKGSIIQMPCYPMHTSPSTWGPSAPSFSPTRFLSATTETADPSNSKDEKKKRKQAFTPFGGGTVLCPGRYFATAEIVGVAAMMAMGFDVEDVRVLGVKLQVMSAQVKHPDGDLKVRIRRRKGWEDVRFSFKCESETEDLQQNLVFG